MCTYEFDLKRIKQLIYGSVHNLFFSLLVFVILHTEKQIRKRIMLHTHEYNSLLPSAEGDHPFSKNHGNEIVENGNTAALFLLSPGVAESNERFRSSSKPLQALCMPFLLRPFLKEQVTHKKFDVTVTRISKVSYCAENRKEGSCWRRVG